MRAIDIHTHLTPLFGYKRILGEKVTKALEQYYKVPDVIKTDEEMVQDFLKLEVKALVIGWDAESNMGTAKVDNAFLSKLVKKYPQVFLGGWAMIDPWKGKAAIQEVERCVKKLGLMGVKFQQVAQGFFPNDRRFYPLYEKCLELKVPVLFHTGNTGLGAGMPGGGGYHLKYTKPIPYLDDVAADFPELTIVGAHPSWPWQDEMIAVMLHKANVYGDLSGWAPKYFPDTLKREINGRLQDKLMFGSDYPEIPPKRWLEEFEAAGYKPEVVEKVLYKNAQRILKVGL